MGSVVKLLSFSAGMRDYLVSVQEARSKLEAAFDHPELADDPRLAQLRDATNAIFDTSIEQVREVYQRLEEAQELERQLPAMAEKAGLEAVTRHMSRLNRRQCLISIGMIFLGAVAALVGVWTIDHIAMRSMVQVKPTCVDQPDGSQVCTMVIPPGASPVKR